MGNRTTFEAERPTKTQKAGKKASVDANVGKGGARERIFDAFRRWGYNEANLDPLGFFGPFPQPDLEGLTGEAAEEARRIYSSSCTFRNRNAANGLQSASNVLRAKSIRRRFWNA